MQDNWGIAFQVEGTSSAKIPRWKTLGMRAQNGREASMAGVFAWAIWGGVVGHKATDAL